MRRGDPEDEVGGSEGILEVRTERRDDTAPGLDSTGAAARMLGGASDGGTLARFLDAPGIEGGGMLELTASSSEAPAGFAPGVSPVSASTLRTSAGISTGRTNRPLPSWARACSGVATAPPGRARNRTWMSSASGSSRMRETMSRAPSLSASTRMIRGCCTATRATSIDRGTSTTAYPAARSSRATRSASAVGSLTKTVAIGPRAPPSSSLPSPTNVSSRRSCRAPVPTPLRARAAARPAARRDAAAGLRPTPERRESSPWRARRPSARTSLYL
jgi:hypothetical protein